MTAMMLTALDANTGTILDITAMTLEQRDRVHGRNTRKRNGYDLICRQCEAGVHLVRYNHHPTQFWRHNPFTARSCILSEFHNSESPEHLAAKTAVALALRQLTGWTAKPEEPFTNGDDTAIVDVYAEHNNPAPHQMPVAWEVQLTPQTHGTFTERSGRIRRASGAPASWITPWDYQLAGHQGLVTDRAAELVVARLYTEPDEDAAPLPPMPLPDVIKGVAGRYPRLRWSASGEDNRFIIYPSNATTKTKPKPPPALEPTNEATDRACERPPITRRPLLRRDDDRQGFAVLRGPEQASFPDFQTAASVCRNVSMGRQHRCIACDEPATDISGLCPKCITERLNHRPPA